MEIHMCGLFNCIYIYDCVCVCGYMYNSVHTPWISVDLESFLTNYLFFRVSAYRFMAMPRSLLR